MIRYDDNDTMLIIEYRKDFNVNILNQLINQYDRYITKITNSLYSKYSNRYSKDDVRQTIIVAFINIVKYKYDIYKGVKFRTYLMNTLKLNTLQIIRDDKYYLAARSERLNCNNIQGFQDCIVGGAGLSDFEKADMIITKDYDFYKEEISIEYSHVLMSMKNLLTKLQMIIVYNCVVLEKSQGVVAKSIGISKNKVSIEFREAMGILREHWSGCI